MKLPDTNVWLALALDAHLHHNAASEWFAKQASEDVGFCRLTQISLLRLLTNQAVFAQYRGEPLTNRQAWQLYEGIRGDSRIAFAVEPPNLESRWRDLAGTQRSSPKLWNDAYLAAFAIEGAHELITIDRAFTQFDGLDPTIL